MNLIKITKKTSSKTQQMETIISILCMLNKIKISKTDISILAHYVVFGLKGTTDTLLIKSKIIKDINALRNTKTRLKKLGFLRRVKELYKSYELNLNSNFKNEDVINLLIKLDNNEGN